MTSTKLRIAVLAAAVLAPVTIATKAAEAPSEGHRTGLTAKITLRDGTIRTATLDGLGCTAAICSRTVVKGNGGLIHAWLDSLAAIQTPRC